MIHENYIWSYNFTYDGSESQRIEHKDLFKEEQNDKESDDHYRETFNPNWYTIIKRQGKDPKLWTTQLIRYYMK